MIQLHGDELVAIEYRCTNDGEGQHSNNIIMLLLLIY